ncbi:MAG: YybH family protein [Alphaproteobacteria bacterium]
MAENDVPQAEREGLEAWLQGFEREIARLDYAAARRRFDPKVTTFSTRMDVVADLDQFERDQWRQVWPSASDFRWNLGGMRAMVSPDGLMVVVAVMWDSTGYHEDGRPFERPGRASFVLMRDRVGGPWRGLHAHVSLKRGVPQTSHGKRTPAQA